MKEFIMAAVPWIVISLCIAVLAVRTGRKGNKKKETYIGEGMSLGMCFGVSLGAAIGFDKLATTLCLGMLIGEVIGMMIPRKKDDDRQNK